MTMTRGVTNDTRVPPILTRMNKTRRVKWLPSPPGIVRRVTILTVGPVTILALVDTVVPALALMIGLTLMDTVVPALALMIGLALVDTVVPALALVDTVVPALALVDTALVDTVVPALALMIGLALVNAVIPALAPEAASGPTLVALTVPEHMAAVTIATIDPAHIPATAAHAVGPKSNLALLKTQNLRGKSALRVPILSATSVNSPAIARYSRY